MSRKVLWQNKWLRVVELNGWFTAHEPVNSKNNLAVAVLPYKITLKGKMYLSRYELNPAHMTAHGTIYHQPSIITGACETGSPIYHAQQELLEEAGYKIPANRFKWCGIVSPSKTSCTRMHLFSVRILGRDKRQEYTGDGSGNEAKEYADWVDAETMKWAKDPYIQTIMMRM